MLRKAALRYRVMAYLTCVLIIVVCFAGIPLQLRNSGDFARLAFSGLDLVPPGVVLVSEWRRDSTSVAPSPSEVNFYGGVARKP